MSALYRIASGHDKIETDIGRLLYDLVATRVLVKVEPCAHGFYDPHIVSIDRSGSLDGGPDRTTCVGAQPRIDDEVLVPVGQWFIEREDGQKVAGPFETKADAHMARVWVEIAKNPETFWIRKGGGDA